MNSYEYPKVTVFFPTFNHIDGFKRNAYIISKLPSKVRNRFHFVVSDDSSDFNIAEKIRDLSFSYGLSYLSGPRSGAVNNWNSCIDTLQSEYGMFIHHDEFPYSTMFYENLIDIVDSSFQPDIVVFDLLKLRSGNLFYHYPISFKKIFYFFKTFLFSVNPLGSPSILLFRRKLDVRFDSNLVWFVDVDWYYRLFSESASILWSDQKIVSDLDFGDSITNSLSIEFVQAQEKSYLHTKYMKDLFSPFFVVWALKAPAIFARIKSVFI